MGKTQEDNAYTETRGGTEQLASRNSVIVWFLWTSDFHWNVDIIYDTDQPTTITRITHQMCHSSSEHEANPMTRNKSDKLIGTQDRGGAQVYASSHQANEELKFTSEVSQRNPWSKNHHIVWRHSDEEDEGIGHSHVAENLLGGLHPIASQDWREIMDKQKDVGHSPNPKLAIQDHLKSCFLSGFQGFIMSRHGEGVSGHWSDNHVC